MNVLSLFDGLSGGRLAFKEAGIEVTNYYRSEIDKHANIVASANYPNDINLGDVTGWRNWDLPKIDVLIAGSPCQGFSYAGKQLNFNDSRSALFFEFVNILNHVKPKFFMLENVKMKQEYQDVISKLLNCEPVKINSKLFSAQSRERLYWTNIPIAELPTINNEVIADIIDSSVTDRFIDKEKVVNRDYKRNYLQYDINNKGNKSQDQRAYYLNGKHMCLDTGCNGKSKILLNDGRVRRTTRNEKEKLQTVPINYTNSVSEAQASKMLGNGWTVKVVSHIFKGLK